MSAESASQVSYRMAGVFTLAGAILVAVGPFAGYQFLGLGLICLLTAGGWIVKGWRAAKNRS